MSTLQDLELLTEVSQLLTELHVDQVLSRVIKLTLKQVGATRATLILLDEHQRQIENLFIADQDSAYEEIDRVQMFRLILERGLAGWVIQQGQSALIMDTRLDPRWYPMENGHQGPRSALSVPIMRDEVLFGVVTLVHEQVGFFNEYHLRLLAIIMNQAAVAIQQARTFQRLQNERQQLENILKTIPDLLLIVDEYGQLTLLSDSVCSLLPDASSYLGLHLSHLAEHEEIFKTIAAALLRSGDWAFEIRSERCDRDFLVRITEHTPKGHLIVLNDVTKLRNLTRFKDQMLRLLSHDIRTPLVVITGYTDLIDMDVHDPQVKGYIAGVRQAIGRMEDLLAGVLRVERVRATPTELYERINLNRMAHEVLTHLDSLAAQKAITLDNAIDCDAFPMVEGDALLIKQAMENYVTNALKYTPEGGCVTIQTQVADESYYFMVTDTGIGIAQHELPFVFEAFYRARQNGSEVKGEGLGLNLVKQAITQHRGDVWVESVIGMGSTFGFRIPLG